MNGAHGFGFSGYPSIGLNGTFDPEEQQSQLYSLAYPLSHPEPWNASYNLPTQVLHNHEYFPHDMHVEQAVLASYAAAPEADDMAQRLGMTHITESQRTSANMFATDDGQEPDFMAPDNMIVESSPSYVQPSQVYSSSFSPYPQTISNYYVEPDNSSQGFSDHEEVFSPGESGHTSDSTVHDPRDSQISLPLHVSTSPRITEKNRVSKPAQKKKSQTKRQRSVNEPAPVQGDAKFLCTFHFAGCDETFGAKNEWKRHVATQHFKFFVYQCDLDECANSGKAPFARKDLFSQHLKRMHFKDRNSKDESLGRELEECTERCKKQNRPPPQTATCGACHTYFKQDRAWDKRMEHVGEHYENGVNPKEYEVEQTLLDWLVKHAIIEPAPGDNAGGWVLTPSSKHSRNPARRRSDPDLVKPANPKKVTRGRRGTRAGGRSMRTRKGSDSVDSFSSEPDAEGETETYGLYLH